MTWRNRGQATLALALVLMSLCAPVSGASAAGPLSADDREDDEIFERHLLGEVNQVDEILKKTQAGENVSEIRLGFFSMRLLVEICAHDIDLSRHIQHDGGDVETYLRTDFQAHPTRELAIIQALAEQNGSPLRWSARYVLDSLLHIPANTDPKATQAADRQALARSLTELEGALVKSAKVIADELAEPPSR